MEHAAAAASSPAIEPVSLIIPAYNAAEFLADAIGSALEQSSPPAEILVIDDGSTDDTAGVARTFGDSVRLARQANLGVSAARNLGIRMARSPWLAFLDADDVMTPDRLRIQGRMLAAHPGLDVVLGRQIYFSGKHSQLPESARDASHSRPAWIPSALLCRASVFQRFGMFDTRRKGAEFIAWFADARELGVASATTEQTVVLRRVHANNLSRNQVNTSGEYTLLIKQILDRRRAA